MLMLVINQVNVIHVECTCIADSSQFGDTIENTVMRTFRFIGCIVYSPFNSALQNIMIYLVHIHVINSVCLNILLLQKIYQVSRMTFNYHTSFLKGHVLRCYITIYCNIGFLHNRFIHNNMTRLQYNYIYSAVLNWFLQ